MCLVTFVMALFVMEGQAAKPWLMGSAVLLIWMISALSVAVGFSQPLPHIAEGMGFFARMKVRLLRLYLWLMALAMILVSIGVVLLSIRAIGIFMRS